MTKSEDKLLQDAVNLIAQHGSPYLASKASGIPSATLRDRNRKAIAAGKKPTVEVTSKDTELSLANERIRALEAQLVGASKNALSAEAVKREIIKIRDMEPKIPSWVVDANPPRGTPGVPTLLCSDWHWGEVIDPNQIGGVNKYNLAIAHERAKTLIAGTLDLLFHHTVNPKYPGIVMALGGDMVSGDIHEELTETNELPIMPVVADLFGVLIWCIQTLADKFGNVFVPCVTGNHGRNTKKKRAKGRHHTSFDWLTYILLQKHFEGDRRISFLIPDGPDAYYRVYNHRYVLTHGDQFYGGDGMIGALGPIIRGDHKKRSRNGQIDMGYETMLMGHWHQFMPLDRVIVNGSLCGYNEFANQMNFMFERPRQALWLTHPVRGITFRIPVYCDKKEKQVVKDWVGIPAVA
jgi:hypothetical protein